MRKQTIWVSVSDFNPTTGIFVWTIYEDIDGDDDKLYASKNYMNTRDNGYIFVSQCDHFWSQERVISYVEGLETHNWFATVIVVGEKKND